MSTIQQTILSSLDEKRAYARKTNRLIADAKAKDSKLVPKPLGGGKTNGSEPMAEGAFARMFGTKAKKIILSNTRDYDGLVILGKKSGFLIQRDNYGKRWVVPVDTMGNGKVQPVTMKKRELRFDDSACFMFRGLLNWVV